MALIDARGIPADQTSVERLVREDLDYRVVDPDDPAQAVPFQRAMSRGFLGAEPTSATLEEGLPTVRSRRNIGVYEQGSARGTLPVATIDSWVTPLTLPGGGDIGMWAISGVTVSGTHRRRGIARSLLEGELRAAAQAGVALAGLTVTEATIYGRYGFGAAVPVSHLTVDTRRAGWAATPSRGRFEYVDREQLAADLGAVHERARRGRPGQVPGWSARWAGIAGLASADTDRERVRGVHFLDQEGVLRGVLAYTLEEMGGTFRFRLRVRMLVGETQEAVAALWRYALQHDLVDEVTADLRPLDDPLPWLVADSRGVTQVVHDHGWLRVLDVPTALAARRYSAPLDVTVGVEDPLDIADGQWRLRVDDTGTMTITEHTGADVDLTLDVSALSALYAGGVRAAALLGAGRIAGEASAVDAVDRSFAAYPVPSLDIWY